jgi:hypothetical protein
MKRWLPVIAGLLAVARLAPADEKADDKAVRAVVERYFTLYAKKDLDGALALWSAKSPEAAQWRTRLKTLFAETGPLTLKKLEVVRVEDAEGGCGRGCDWSWSATAVTASRTPPWACSAVRWR